MNALIAIGVSFTAWFSAFVLCVESDLLFT
jgi:hypothetical protein